MTDTPKYFVYPFGTGGDLATIPDPTQGSGVVSYQEGFGPDYSLASSDPSSLNVPRASFNQLMYDTTLAIQQLQQNGYPVFITTAMNDGSAFSYQKNAYVFQPSDSKVYYSLVDSNTTVPPSAGNWQVVAPPLWLNYAADTGSANHAAVAPSPPIDAYGIGQVVLWKPTAANTGACDININTKGVKNIKTLTGANPAGGSFLTTGLYALAYDGTNFVAMNTSAAQVGSFVTIKTQKFPAGGTYTPSTGMLYCNVKAQAAGAGGGGASGGNGTDGGGAGGGEYIEATFSAADIGASKVVTIGIAGAGGATSSTGVDGNDGGDTSLGSLIVAHGGKKGYGGQTVPNGAKGGLGGTGGTGDLVLPGRQGGNGSANGNISSADVIGNQGGNSHLGFGGSVTVIGTAPTPSYIAPSGYGAGGCGGVWSIGASTAVRNGQDGVGGYMLITEYCSQ